MQNRVKNFIEHSYFQNFIITVIIFNAAIMGINVSYKETHFITELLDNICIAIFVVEIALRIFVYRFDFIKNAWNIFDFIIVAICLLPSNNVFSSLRLFRTIRVLRLVSIIPKMRLVSLSLVKAIPAMVSIGVLLSFSIFTVLLPLNYTGKISHNGLEE